jgi:hypothetical protein
MTPQGWSSVFGGGSKKVLQVATSSQQYPLPGSYASVRLIMIVFLSFQNSNKLQYAQKTYVDQN